MKARPWFARAAFALVAVASCTVPALDLTGKACPCTSDFVCDVTTNTCVAPGSLTPDATTDSDGAMRDGDVSGEDGMATDARVDSDAGDGGPSTFCNALTVKPTFCADFDSINAAPWGFSSFASAITSALGADSTESISRQSAYFEVKSESTNAGYSTLTKTLPNALTTASKLDIDLDFRLEKLNSEVPIVSVLVTTTSATYRLYLGLQSGNARIQEQTTPNGGASVFGGNNMSAPIAVTDGWVHAHLEPRELDDEHHELDDDHGRRWRRHQHRPLELDPLPLPGGAAYLGRDPVPRGPPE